MHLIRVGGIAINQTPLDWNGNRDRILAALATAKQRAISIVCLPELCISGYGCEDAFQSPGVQVAATLPDALARAEALPGEIYLCGGQRIFEETFALTRPLRLHLTLIHAEIAGDRFFPEWRQPAWRETARRESADANFRYTFLTLER